MKFLEFIYETHNLHVQIEIENVDTEFVNQLIDDLSFIYKKRKDKYIRPKSINGKMSDDNIDLTVVMHNKDIIKIDFKSGILTLNINGELVYDMDEIIKENVSKKINDVYSKYLSKHNFKVMKKFNEI